MEKKPEKITNLDGWYVRRGHWGSNYYIFTAYRTKERHPEPSAYLNHHDDRDGVGDPNHISVFWKLECLLDKLFDWDVSIAWEKINKECKFTEDEVNWLLDFMNQEYK